MRKYTIPLLLSVAIALLGPGCARGSGEGRGRDAGSSVGLDSGAPEDARSSADVAPYDASGSDAQAEGSDSGFDPSGDSGLDPRSDSGSASAIDAGVDSGIDAGRPPIDSGVDSGIDAGRPPIDSGSDSGSDAGPIDPCRGVDCSAMTSMCRVGMCDPSTGACVVMPRGDGIPCSDGNACTIGDVCSGTSCVAGAARDCSSMSGPCGTAACNPASGGCVVTPLPDGTSCGSSSGCTSSACRAGACVTSPTPDCGSCGPEMYCAAGACGASPMALTYDFESGAFPVGWSNGTGGTAAWTIETGGAYGGIRRARSGRIRDSEQSRLSFTIRLVNATTLSFWLMTSSEVGFDVLELWIDGVPRQQWSGATPWTLAAIALAPGTRTIEWRYEKDPTFTSSTDAVWIDEVTIGPALDPSTGFEGSSSLPVGYGSAGDAAWTVQNASVHSGTNAATSGTINDRETSSMVRNVSLLSATTLTFWYRVSSETRYDFLRVYDGGTLLGEWSGDVPWAMASYPLAAGSHTIEWRYSKDDTMSARADRAWIDDISFGTAPPSDPLCGP